MSDYKDYGYTTNFYTCAHSFLAGSLLSMLNRANNKTLLDVGCGNGAIANFLIKKGFDVYGTDASVTGIEQAQKTHKNRFFLQDLTKDDLPTELSSIRFDTIISTEVIEHLYDPRKYLAFCKKVLEKNGGGELVISTPYHGYLKNCVIAISGTLDNHFTALWDGGHIKFWSRKTLTCLLVEQGYRVTQFKGCGRLPYLWKSMLIKAEL